VPLPTRSIGADPALLLLGGATTCISSSPCAPTVPLSRLLACVRTEHSIDQEGLLRGGRFLQQTLTSPEH
jgi:hypothetical protein